MAKISVEMNLYRFVDEIGEAIDKLSKSGFKPEINFSELISGALLHEWLRNLRNNHGSRNGLVYEILGVYDEGRDAMVARLALGEGEPSQALQRDVLLAIQRHFKEVMEAKDIH